MSESKSIEEKILNYLLKNPNASDTLEGVARWWLEMEKVDHAIEMIADTLNSLLERGVIEKVPTGENISIYRISRSIKRDI